MNKDDDTVERLAQFYDSIAALREAAASDPKLDSARRRVRAWQAARLARTYADLLTNSRMDLAAAFFLNDLYGSEGLGKLDADVRRIVPTMSRTMPAASLEIVAAAVEFEALSEDLDTALAMATKAKSGKLSAKTYGAAYRKVGRRADRERQICLIEDLGKPLDRLVHRPFVGAALRISALPARLVGLGEIHEFLIRGYDAFTRMGDAREFFDLVVDRERKLVEAVFSGDDGGLGN